MGDRRMSEGEEDTSIREEKRPLRDSAENLAMDDSAGKHNGHTHTKPLDDGACREKADLKEQETLLPTVEIRTSGVQLQKEPTDRYLIVYLILLVHGVGTLMPWNMFITATDYFTEHKLKEETCTNESVTESPEMSYTSLTNASVSVLSMLVTPTTAGCEETSSIYRNYFLSSLGFVAQIPNVLLNAINVFARVQGGNTSKRIVWSIIIIIVMFIFTVVLAMVDSSTWPDVFFWITMITVVIINMANGVYQNSVYGTAAVLPMKYTNAVVLGSNISGTLTSVIMLISISATPNPRTSAIYYFLAAIFILLIAFDTYFTLPMLPFYRFHKDKAEKEQSNSKVDEKIEAVSTRPPYMYVFKKCWKQFLGVWFVFFVTLTCFPAIQANVEKVEGDGFPIPEKYFTGVTCFLFFNAFAMIGNLTTEFIRKPGPRWVWIPILLRVLFIPFFMLCNFIPKSGVRGIPVLINNNWVYTAGSILMAYSSGYLSSLTMMYAPRELKEPEYQGVAGMMAAFFLIAGIFCGVIFSLPVTIMVESL